MERGDVYIGPFAYADADRSKPRPVLVLSTDPFNRGPDVVIAMITSSGRRLAEPGPGDVVLNEWRDESAWTSEAVHRPERAPSDHHALPSCASPRSTEQFRHRQGRARTARSPRPDVTPDPSRGYRARGLVRCRPSRSADAADLRKRSARIRRHPSWLRSQRRRQGFTSPHLHWLRTSRHAAPRFDGAKTSCCR